MQVSFLHPDVRINQFLRFPPSAGFEALRLTSRNQIILDASPIYFLKKRIGKVIYGTEIGDAYQNCHCERSCVDGEVGQGVTPSGSGCFHSYT